MSQGRLHLEIPGEPTPWARARRNGKRYFTAERQADYIAEIRGAWEAAGEIRLEGPLQLICNFHLERPATHTKKDGGLRKGAPLLPIKRPDVDNLIKLIADALQDTPERTIAYRDDGQIIQMMAGKLYAAEPRTVVDLHELTSPEVAR